MRKIKENKNNFIDKLINFLFVADFCISLIIFIKSKNIRLVEAFFLIFLACILFMAYFLKNHKRG